MLFAYPSEERGGERVALRLDASGETIELGAAGLPDGDRKAAAWGRRG